MRTRLLPHATSILTIFSPAVFCAPAYPSIAVAGTTSWLAAYVAATSISNEFTIQMCTTGGNLWIGDYDPSYLASPFLYVPVLQANYYSVLLTSLTLSYQSVLGTTSSTRVLQYTDGTLGPCTTPSNFDCAKVDSGTTQMIFPSRTYATLISAITSDSYYQSVFNNGLPGYDVLNDQTCTQADAPGMPSLATLQTYLPKLTFNFSNAAGTSITSLTIVAIPGYMTILYDVSGSPYYCPGLSDGGSSYPLLGFAFMNQFTVRHDITNQRLGFAQTQACGIAAPALVSYEWSLGPWGGCGASCGSGIQWRQVNCTDSNGATQADVLCAVTYLPARPADSRQCNTQTCSGGASTSFLTLAISTATLHAGQVTNVTYSYTGATPDYFALYLTPADGADLPPYYITRNASCGTNGMGLYQWTVPASAPTGSYLLAAYSSAVSSSSSHFASGTVNLTACAGGACETGPCNTTAKACNGHGACRVSGAMGVCTCVGGWTGGRCEQSPLVGICTLRCLNSGSVTSGCTCACPAAYTGPLCELSYSTMTMTLGMDSTQANSSLWAATLAETVTADVSFALGLTPAAMEVSSVAAVDAATVQVVFAIINRNLSVLQGWTTQLKAQVASPSSPLSRGLTVSTSSNVVVTQASSLSSPSSSSSTAGGAAVPWVTSSSHNASTTTYDSGDDPTGPSMLIIIVACSAGGAFALGFLVWFLSCLCRRGRGGQVEVGKAGLGGMSATRAKSSSTSTGSGASAHGPSVVNVSPKGSQLQMHQHRSSGGSGGAKAQRKDHTQSYDYGY